MEKLQRLNPAILKDLTSEKILGLPELIKTEYTDQEIKAIKLALINFAVCKNENYSPETIESWINSFAELRYSAFQVIKSIRLAKLEKKYGQTEFATFVNIELQNYSETYKHEKKNDNGTDPETERLNREVSESLKNGSTYQC